MPNITFHRQLCKKGFNFDSPHILGVTILVKADKTLCPLAIDVFSTDGVVFEPNSLTHLIEQTRLAVHGV